MNELSRYSTDQMNTIWSPDWKYRRWAEIEIAAAKARNAPPAAIEQMRAATVPSAQAVESEEANTRHDVIAFLNLWREGMGDEGRSWSHRGLTSSDVVDTANGLRFKASTDVIQGSLKALMRQVGRQAVLYQDAVRVGRTHGQHAEVTTWGWRLAVFFYDLQRAERRMSMLSDLYEVGKLSGPVGDYKSLAPADELAALRDLGLRTTFASTQVVSRDTYVDYVHALAQVASVVESIAMEIRLSSRTEVAEMTEGFDLGQRGSSAMPHKRNPIKAEQLCGIARLVRSQVDPVAQGVALHNERDISHSSVERVALAAASMFTDYALATATTLLNNLRVDTDRMRSNVVGNQELMSSLIKDRLVERNDADPKKAYEVVFWAFTDWDGSSVKALVKALENSWSATFPDADSVPEFEEMVDLLEDPEDLVGQTRTVFLEIEHLLDGMEPYLPF